MVVLYNYVHTFNYPRKPTKEVVVLEGCGISDSFPVTYCVQWVQNVQRLSY